jgi:hypothetical protein
MYELNMSLERETIEHALENSCQNAKQRDRPAASLSTQNKLAGFPKQVPHTTVKAEPRLGLFD